MTAELIILIIIAILLAIVAIKLFTQKTNDNKLDAISTEIKRIEESVRKEISFNRIETNNQSVRARSELSNSLESFEKKLQHLTQTIDYKLTAFSESNNNNAAASRKEIKEALDIFKKDLAQSIQEFNSIQKENFFALLNKQSEQNSNTGNSLTSMRETLEQKIKDMQQSNEQKLEQMRITVDEKLQQTLEAIGRAFESRLAVYFQGWNRIKCC